MNISFARPFRAIRNRIRADLVAVLDPALAGLRQQTDTILQEQRHMSETQTQLQTDVAQMAADLKTITDGFASLTNQIASLKAAAAQSGTVSPDLQAQIDNLHTTAQGILSSVSGGAATTTSTTSTSGAQPAATTDQPAAPATTDTTTQAAA